MPTEEYTLEDIPGVGEKTAKKLMDIGILDLQTLAHSSPIEIARAADISEDVAEKIISKAKELLGLTVFEDGLSILEREKNALRITTCSKNLDRLLGGGVWTQAITETWGHFASGKTQLGFQLAVNVQRAIEEGGLGRNCLWIDTEGTFSSFRVSQMTEALGMNVQNVLKNIIVAKVTSASHQMEVVEKYAPKIIKERNIGLIVVDSITANFRAEYIGRGELAERQQKLNSHLHKLKRLADAYNLAVYVTNQVMMKPDVIFGDATIPVGGTPIAHISNYRIYLKKSKGNLRIAGLADASNLETGEVTFLITKEGIRDPEE
ncbi:MAG: DNA repair and recombination protein RadA [Candidatus Aenigmatarchaeota archaeon]